MDSEFGYALEQVRKANRINQFTPIFVTHYYSVKNEERLKSDEANHMIPYITINKYYDIQINIKLMYAHKKSKLGYKGKVPLSSGHAISLPTTQDKSTKYKNKSTQEVILRQSIFYIFEQTDNTFYYSVRCRFFWEMYVLRLQKFSMDRQE